MNALAEVVPIRAVWVIRSGDYIQLVIMTEDGYCRLVQSLHLKSFDSLCVRAEGIPLLPIDARFLTFNGKTGVDNIDLPKDAIMQPVEGGYCGCSFSGPSGAAICELTRGHKGYCQWRPTRRERPEQTGTINVNEPENRAPAFRVRTPKISMTRTCEYVDGCDHKPTRLFESEPTVGWLCEEHYQQALNTWPETLSIARRKFQAEWKALQEKYLSEHNLTQDSLNEGQGRQMMDELFHRWIQQKGFSTPDKC
jgi:hypothetical protein